MVVVHRARGFRFMIYVDDHEPAHVHVRGDGEAKIVLQGSDGRPELLYAVRLTRADQKRILREVIEQQDVLLSHWRRIHG